MATDPEWNKNYDEAGGAPVGVALEGLVGRRPQIGDKWLRGMTGKVEIVDISETRVWLFHNEPGREPKYSSRKLAEWDETFAKTLAITGTTFIPANAESSNPHRERTSDAK